MTARWAVAPPGDVPDKRFSYSPQAVDEYFSRIGASGIRLYAYTQFTLDLAFPILYTALFMCLIARWCPPAMSHWFVWAPLAIFVADIAENSCLVYLAFHRAVNVPQVARVASLCTSVKWTLVVTCAVGLLVGRLITLRRKSSF